MYLKRLELQGYKSFATKTVFEFDRGLTAIVGPNGSGKSNIADAIRWVLGEQSYRVLRGQRTEDMIFSGSEQRSRLGMAQAQLTFDNSDNWLPVDFSEVTIARRAYRSGENEYLINGNRVRLRDVAELLSQCGLSRRTYAVIGQGLVDMALSLSATERRELFEEAAGITLYQAKREETLSRLEATQANLLRVRDIIAENEPHLQRLARQAQRAEEHARLTTELHTLLQTWYGYQWGQNQKALASAQAAVSRAKAQCEEQQAALAQIEADIAAYRTEQSSLRQQLSALHRQSSQLHAQAEARQRDLAVLEERERLLIAQQETIHRELATFETELATHNQRVAQAEAHLARLQQELETRRSALRKAEERLAARERERQALLAEQNELQRRAFETAANLADCRNRLAQLAERWRELDAEANHHRQMAEQTACQLSEAAQQVTQAAAALEAQKQELAAALNRRAQLQADIANARTYHAQLLDRQAELRRQSEGIENRREFLLRQHEEGTAYYPGVRSVLQTRLNGIVGLVSELLVVPPELEEAIEVALGGHLQDIVVERWDDAQGAIEHLKSTRSGRATFLPLDTIRPGRPLAPPAETGVVGLASRLVQCPAHLQPVADLLLGRTIVVEDLPTARRILSKLQGSGQMVTLEGELIRAAGSVSGGRGGRTDQSLLRYKRELQELPAQLEELAAQQRQLESEIAAARAEIDRLTAAEQEVSAELEALEQKLAQSEHLTAAQRRYQRVQQEEEWHRALVERLTAEQAALTQKENQTVEQRDQWRAEEISIQTRLEEIQQALAALPTAGLSEAVIAARTAVAVAEESLQGQRAILNSHRTDRAQLRSRLQTRRDQLAALKAETEQVAAELAELRRDHEVITQAITALEAEISPIEARLAELEQKLTELQAEENRRRERLRELESQYSQAILELHRCEDRLRHLREQIENELGLVELQLTEGLAEQPPLPLHPLIQSLPVIDAIPPNLEQEIRQLKARRGRLGPVNPDAPKEYAEALERNVFLTQQAHDLEQASRSLRSALAELDQLMAREFMTTFEAVAEAFKEYFTLLFDGGTARLSLTDPHDLLQTGVEIVVRPPGKRLQHLAQLSGGERALAAAALIFAILKVSPTPFCVLDEVDAMLDEANVDRFRETLKSLADKTQFIVITHNRRTIEAADTIYGISMGADSTSCVVSLRLDGEDLASPQRAA